tara:strand:+ start:1215 stop:1868 length:654 start_codon:yes stop_codon:yes gene_type:complete
MAQYDIKIPTDASRREIFFDRNTSKLSYKDDLGIVEALDTNTTPSSIHVLVKPKAGNYITAMIAASQYAGFGTQVTNTIQLIPFIPSQSISYTSISINVLSGAAGSARILIYSNLDGLPTTKLYESASLDISTSGYKTATTSGTFIKGTTYWLGVQSSTSSAYFDTYPPNSLLTLTYNAASPLNAISVNAAIGAAPATISPASTSYISDAIPIIQIL